MECCAFCFKEVLLYSQHVSWYVSQYVYMKRIQSPEPWIDGCTNEKTGETPRGHANWITLCKVGNTEHNPVL